MSRGVFNSHNKVGEVLFFNTTSNSGTTFDPNVTFASGSDRVSWDYGLGGGYVAGNNQSITYPDNGVVKNCQLRTNKLSNLSVLNFFQDDIYGDLDLTKFYNLNYISFNGSSQLSAVTHSYSPTPITSYDLSDCNITGQHNISMLDVGGDFQMSNNSNLTGVTHSFNTLSTLFDGVDDYINVPDNSNLSFGNGVTDSPFSISGWVKMDDISGFRLLNKYVGSTYEYSFGTGGAGNLQLYILDSGSQYRARLQSTFLNTGQWYHIVATYSGVGGNNAQDGIKIYVDGVRVDDTSVSVGTYSAMNNTTVPVHIGKLNTSYTDGNIDEVAIFNSELSQSDVTTIYNGGVPNDISSLNPLSWWRCGDNDTFPTITDNGSGGNNGTMTNMSSTNFVSDTPIGPGQSFTRYTINNCDLTGTHDLSIFPKLAGDFRVHTNANLTKLIHTNTDPSASNFTRYWAFNCDLTGNHDMSVLTNIGGQIYINSNTNLTGITHSPTTGVITRYWVYNCDLTGNHDLTMFTKLGGSFQFFSNPNLISITHTANTDTNWTLYTGSNCDLTGNHDMTWCPNLGGNFNLSGNINLTGITHTASNKLFTFYQLQNTKIQTHDISMLTGLGGFFSMAGASVLSGVTNPLSTQTFTDYNLNECNLINGVDFYPLSGANFADGEIRLDDNNMSASIVNTMLQDFSGITSNNVNSWSGVTLNISGSNSAPDTTSGGINGVEALSYLTGVTPQWSITTT